MECINGKCSFPNSRDLSRGFIPMKLAEDKARRMIPVPQRIETIISEADKKILANPNVKFKGVGSLADQAAVHLAEINLYPTLTAEQKNEYAAKLQAIVDRS